jgi:hypothetical protein
MIAADCLHVAHGPIASRICPHAFEAAHGYRALSNVDVMSDAGGIGQAQALMTGES